MTENEQSTCENPLQSGMKCVMPTGHDGYCFDGFGLRDPKPEGVSA